MLVIQRSLALWPFVLLSLGHSSPGLAQVVPDDSLDSEASQLQRQGDRIIIGGGSDRAPILFHSFEQFSIADDQQVFFANPQGINAILSRVTGDTSSTIDGTLGVLGSADLFLLNPNGIVFGPNAQLDIAGSFTASTADSIRVDDFDFSAETPTPVPLLTLDITPGIQLGRNAPDRLIQNNGTLMLGRGQTLTLDAGSLEQLGTINVPNGIVQLQGEMLQLAGAVDTRAGGGNVGILQVKSSSDLTIQPTGPLTNQAINNALENNNVVVESDRDLALRGALTSTSANALTLRAGQTLRLRPQRPGGSEASTLAGNVTLQSGGNLVVRHPLEVITRQTDPYLTLHANGNIVLRNPQAFTILLQLTGNQGMLTLQGQGLTLERGGVLTVLDGVGMGPDIDIDIDQDVILRNATVGTRAENAQTTGDIHLRAGRSVQLLESSFINAVPFSTAAANTGSIHIQAADTLLLQASFLQTQAAGNAGDIHLDANRIILDGALGQSLIAADTSISSVGDAGNITLTASETVELIGDRPGPFTIPDAQALGIERVITETFGNTTIQATAFGSGDSGTIQVDTEQLTLRDGALLANVAGLFGSEGDAGNIQINATDIQLRDGVLLASGTVGTQKAGEVNIQSDRLRLDGGAVIAVSTAFGTGDAGELFIDTQELTVAGGSLIAANTEGGGSGGLLDIQAQTVTIEGTSLDGSFPSTILTDVTSQSTGEGGQLRVQTESLQVLNGGQIRASTQGPEDAGDVNLRANRITLRGTSPNGVPSTIEAQATNPDNLPTIGSAGTLRLDTDRLIVSDQARLTTQSELGDGGSINLVVDDVLILRREGQISATAGTLENGGGDGGNITLQAGFIVVPGTENSDISANAFAGNGGNIEIQTNGLLLGIAFRDRPTELSDITASSEFGLAGTVTIEGLSDDLVPAPLPLLTGLANPEDQLTAGCLLDEDASFVVTGRGGIPASPREILHQTLIWQDPRSGATVRHLEDGAAPVAQPADQRPEQLSEGLFEPIEAEARAGAEAKGWRVNELGQTELLLATNPLRNEAPFGCPW